MNDQTAPATVEDTKVRIRPNLKRYVRDKSGRGKRTHRTDDFVARTLAGKNLDEIKQGATLLGIDHNKWSLLNDGQQRMLIGNKIRHLLYGVKDPTISEGDVTDVYGEPVAPAEEASAEETEVASADPEEGGEQGSDEPDTAPQDEPTQEQATTRKRVYKGKK